MFKEIINKLILIVPMLNVSAGAVGDYGRADEVEIEEFVVNKGDAPNDPVAIIYTEKAMSRANDSEWKEIYEKVTEALGIHSNLKSAGFILGRVDDKKFSLKLANTITLNALHPHVKLDSGENSEEKYQEIPLFLNCLSIILPDASIFKDLPIINKEKNIFSLSDLLAEMNDKWPQNLHKGELGSDMPFVAIKTGKWTKSSQEFRKYVENLRYSMTIAEAIVDFIGTKGFDKYETVARRDLFSRVIREMRKRFAAIYGQSSDSSSSNQLPSTKIRLVPASLVDSDEIDHDPDANPGYHPETNEFRLKVSRMGKRHRNPADENRWRSAEDNDNPRGSLPRFKRPRQDSVDSYSPIKRIRISDDNLDQSEDRNTHEHGAAEGSGEVVRVPAHEVYLPEAVAPEEFAEAEYEAAHEAVADEEAQTAVEIRPVYEPVTEDPYGDPVDAFFESFDPSTAEIAREGDLAPPLSQVKEELPSLVNNPRVMPIVLQKKRKKSS